MSPRRTLKAKRKAAKDLGTDLKTAEKLERNVFIEKREVAEKREVSMMEQRDQRDAEERLKKMTRLVQICPPNMTHPMLVKITTSEDDLGSQTQRGEGGFGSTGS